MYIPDTSFKSITHCFAGMYFCKTKPKQPLEMRDSRHLPDLPAIYLAHSTFQQIEIYQ